MAATFYASAVGGSDDTVYADLQEATSGLEPRGGVVGFTGALPDGAIALYKVGFVIAGAPDADPIELAGNYRADGVGIDPDPVDSVPGITVRYRAGEVIVENVPWTVRFLGFSDGDTILELDEKAQLSVWLLDRDNLLGVDTPGAVLPRGDGSATLGAGDEFTIEIESRPDHVLRISRVVPAELTPILDMR